MIVHDFNHGYWPQNLILRPNGTLHGLRINSAAQPLWSAASIAAFPIEMRASKVDRLC